MDFTDVLCCFTPDGFSFVLLATGCNGFSGPTLGSSADFGRVGAVFSLFSGFLTDRNFGSGSAFVSVSVVGLGFGFSGLGTS